MPGQLSYANMLGGLGLMVKQNFLQTSKQYIAGL